MTWRKSIRPVQLPVNDPWVVAGQIDGLLEALIISSDGRVCANVASRKDADPERSSVLLAGAAAALRELLQVPAGVTFSLTCQSSEANLLLRPISPDRLLHLVFRPEFPVSLAAYYATQLAEATQRNELRISSGSV